MAEFDGQRARLYGLALEDYPEARKGDIELMNKYLSPRSGEVILEVGAGNGIFSGHIADAVLPNGKLIVSDPSKNPVVRSI
jgi:ubiquinone/menaquinone biosynthesis C-methylase UbiE